MSKGLFGGKVLVPYAAVGFESEDITKRLQTV